jgi:hypothetical protein
MSKHVTIAPSEAADRAHCADRRDAKGQMALLSVARSSVGSGSFDGRVSGATVQHFTIGEISSANLRAYMGENIRDCGGFVTIRSWARRLLLCGVPTEGTPRRHPQSQGVTHVSRHVSARRRRSRS